MSNHPENRLREYLLAPAGAVLTSAPAMVSSGSFVPCPMMACFGYAHQSFIAEVYRLAREMTETQLQQTARPFPPAFSLN